MLGRVLVAGVFGGAIAGAGAGLIDGLWTWGSLGQFAPGTGDKLRALAYLAAAYGLAAAVAGPFAMAAALALWRHTRLGDIARHGLARHREARARDPRDALAGLSLAIAGVPSVTLALGGAYAIAAKALALKKHVGLVVALSMLAALGALALAVAATFAAGRLVEAGLRRLARGERLGRWLSAPAAPAVAAVALAIPGAALGAALAWPTLKLVVLRPYVALGLIAALGAPALVAGDRRADRLRGWWRLAAPALLVALAAAVLAFGAGDGARKAADHYSGLGGRLTRLYRAASPDLDGDGYGRWLGGGDCDDGDAAVHPSAVEIPDDGIDQNCVGGDATTEADGGDTRFVPVPASLPSQPNILLVTIDTLRADHVGAYGYDRPTTPALDALAAEGAVFVNAWAHAPSTRYSMPSILTGRYPLAVAYDDSIWWPALAPEATTIAEVLGQRGLYAGAILNYSYFEPRRRMDQGFDEYDNENAKLHVGRDPARTTGSSSREQTDKAIAFLERNALRQFFLWVHYYDPHFTYERHDDTHDFGAAPADLYDHEIRFTDDQIARLVADLKRRGLYEKTIIVVTGDHGEGFGEHGIDLHGYHLYAAQTRVPLIVRVPGLPASRPTLPAGHVDILPTLANLAGGAPAPWMQGRSLVGAAAGGDDAHADRWVFQQLSFENDNEQRGAASQRCHVLYYVSPQNAWELYRVDEDPGETRDVIDAPGACGEARAVLEAWYDRSQISPDAARALLPERPAIAQPLDVDLGDEVRLLAVELPPGPVRPGDRIEITFTWEARGTPPPGWKVFAHFEAPGGARFLGDHEPARPFAWWRAGQFIRYTHAVTVPRHAGRGDYVMWLGMFRGNERRSVTAPDARVRVRDDRAAVGVLKVQR